MKQRKERSESRGESRTSSHCQKKHIYPILLLTALVFSIINFQPPELFVSRLQEHIATQQSRVVQSAQKNKSLPIFWINLNRSVDRRDMTAKSHSDLQKQGFDITSHRVEAADVQTVKNRIAQHKYIMNDIKLVLKKGKPSKRTYRFAEAACMLSHLQAIREAYMADYDQVLITEDDAYPSKEFAMQWEKYVALAPRNWNILQFYVSRDYYFQRGLSMKEPWISWQQDHSATGAYLINRKGMAQILNQTMLLNSQGDPVWLISEPGLLAADEALYYMAEHTYSATYPFWFELQRVGSTILNGKLTGTFTDKYVEHYFPPSDDRYLAPINEKLLVLTTLFVASDVDASKQLDFLELDAELLESWQPAVTWKIRVVAIDEHLKALVDKRTAKLPQYVKVETFVAENPANKYSLVNDSIPIMGQFDSVLLKNCGMRLAGFAWRTFYDRSQKSLVSSPMNHNPEYALYRNRLTTIESLKPDHNQDWTTIWEEPSFLDVSPAQVTSADSRFVLLKAPFAASFFSKVLPKALADPTDGWEAEGLLCNAAKAFRGKSTPCTLVPVYVNLRGQTGQNF